MSAPTADGAVTAARFWRGEGALTVAAATAVRDATRTATDAALPRRLVVEVVDDGDGAWLVLLATQAEGEDAQRALIAFGSRCVRVDRLRQLGFMATEAAIRAQPQADGSLQLEVSDPLCIGGVPACWVRVHGVRLPPAAEAPAAADPGAAVAQGRQSAVFTTELPQIQSHCQVQAAPAPEDPIRQVEREVRVRTRRRGVQPLGRGAAVDLLNLGALEAAALLPRTWALPDALCGHVELPAQWLPPPGPGAADPAIAWAGALRRAPRVPMLAAAGYRFTNVDIVGFRIDLGGRDDVAATLQQMVEPLNFHRHPQGRLSGWGTQAFRWRPAARVLVIELLRYGRMYWGEQEPQPGAPFTAQHELLLRTLVGRVDDEGAQARDPALFVPAIFVDNPWSRMIGRELQGFPKQLARFCSADGPLDLSGCRPGTQQPVPLARVTRVHTEPCFGAGGRGGVDVLGLELPPGSDDPALWADVRPLMGGAGALRRARWRQGDFTDPQFRRSFAGQALGLDPAAMPSVQVSPVDGRALPSAWVTGTMLFDRMEAGTPAGVARLHLPRDDAAARAQLPPAWRALRRLFPEGTIVLSTGSWYRARADLRMEPTQG